jgi:hypothetical protein
MMALNRPILIVLATTTLILAGCHLDHRAAAWRLLDDDAK